MNGDGKPVAPNGAGGSTSGPIRQDDTSPDTEPFGPAGTINGTFVDPITGFRCLVLTGPLGQLNGYIGIPEGHPLHGVGYGDCLEDCGAEWCYSHSLDGRIDVHGGITYSGWLEGVAPEGTAGVWWIGFDTAHAGDLVPGASRYYAPFRDEVLRGPEYVASECCRLAHQLGKFADA